MNEERLLDDHDHDGRPPQADLLWPIFAGENGLETWPSFSEPPLVGQLLSDDATHRSHSCEQKQQQQQ